MSIVQFLQIPTAEVIGSGSSTVNGVAEIFRTASGNTATLWASQHEDNKVAGLAAVWESQDAQRAWTTSQEGQAVESTIKKLSTGPLYDDTVIFSEDPFPVLKANAVELISCIYSVDQYKARKGDIEQGFKHFQKGLSEQAPEVDRGLVSGWGQEFDYEGVPSRRFTLLIGWKSVDAHYVCKSTKAFTDNIHWLVGYGYTKSVMAHYAYGQSLAK
ncbi:hypothetical protein O1611_g881 [Lasiodiplodia mahajangana]|uniref:Uncharacterized protein n=1 Tax=Lasiodiplodia mahajangana TaxID=1108764 RepID=A0ACC2JYY3_9PEZI|nr:hypothetical protein O1611_g881 [Lasiodiplodia mahajangana]